jgi:GNAT superfamily N-acetyltransferase
VTPIVRLVTPADAPHCERLATEARDEACDTRGAIAFFAQFPRSTPVDGGFGLIAEVDGTVVGFALVSIHSVAATMVASIERVFVTRRARRVGIGDALITATRREASQRGCTQLDALALPGDRDTKNLFERNGLTARLIVASTQL